MYQFADKHDDRIDLHFTFERGSWLPSPSASPTVGLDVLSLIKKFTLEELSLSLRSNSFKTLVKVCTTPTLRMPFDHSRIFLIR